MINHHMYVGSLKKKGRIKRIPSHKHLSSETLIINLHTRTFRIIHRQKNRKEGSRDAVDVREDGDASEEERIHNQSSGQSLWSSSAAPLRGLAPALALMLSLALIVRGHY